MQPVATNKRTLNSVSFITDLPPARAVAICRTRASRWVVSHLISLVLQIWFLIVWWWMPFPPIGLIIRFCLYHSLDRVEDILISTAGLLVHQEHLTCVHLSTTLGLRPFCTVLSFHGSFIGSLVEFHPFITNSGFQALLSIRPHDVEVRQCLCVCIADYPCRLALQSPFTQVVCHFCATIAHFRFQ